MSTKTNQIKTEVKSENLELTNMKVLEDKLKQSSKFENVRKAKEKKYKIDYKLSTDKQKKERQKIRNKVNRLGFNILANKSIQLKNLNDKEVIKSLKESIDLFISFYKESYIIQSFKLTEQIKGSDNDKKMSTDDIRLLENVIKSFLSK